MMRLLTIISFALVASLGMPFLATGAESVNTTVTTGALSDDGTVVTSPKPAPSTGGKDIKLINPLKGGESLESFLLDILEFVIRIGSIFVVLMVVFVGFKFVNAQGKSEELEKAREMLLWTVLGALILLGSQAIAMAIKATTDALSVGG